MLKKSAAIFEACPCLYMWSVEQHNEPINAYANTLHDCVRNFLGFGFLWKKPENQRAKTTGYSLADVGRAIYLFEEKFGRYPIDLDELASPKGDFIYPTARVLDAWDHPIVYKLTPAESRPFKLYSIGANNKDEAGDGDDLNFWSLKTPIQQ